MLFSAPPKSMRLTLRVLSHLLSYPSVELLAHLGELAQALRDEAVLDGQRTDELEALMHRLARLPSMQVQSEYVELFDRGRSTALNLFEHVHGDSRDRGPAMIDLIQTFEKAGLMLRTEELPDHLPVLLEFASTQPPAQAREFLGEIAHIVRVIFSALQKRQSPYASVLAAVLELAGHKAEAVPVPVEEAMDESWEEPPVFGGCSTQGQAKPGQPQPIQLVRKAVSSSQGVQA
jgi:nitrate reductase delta subunit